MANILTQDQQKALAAAQGNPVLLELLESIMNTVGATQQATNTTGKNVPAQAQAAVSYLAGSYIVEITNPGASSPLSQLQSAQRTQGATQATTLQPVTPILHQVRCATSPAFGINDNVQTFGGDSGSTQTYWTLTNLGSGTFYFQIRSSYDGVNFNQWKNANGGQAVTSLPGGVTLEQQTNMDWAVFTLPGGQLMAVGDGFAPDQGTFGLPENLYSSALAALAAPNGFVDIGVHVGDIPNSDISISIPQDTSGSVGIPDYPTLVSMKYGDRSTPQVVWSGSANLFGVLWDPAGANVTQYPASDGASFWVRFRLPGGAWLAIGQGLTEDGSPIEIPADLNWITFANLLSVCSPHGDPGGPDSAQGIASCQLVAGVGSAIDAQCKYGNGSTTWPGHANWLAVASNLSITTLTDGSKWIIINLAGGNRVAFGSGQAAANGDSISIPPGFSQANMVAIPSPGGFTGASSNIMHGVAKCYFSGLAAFLSYVDGQSNVWSGPINWMAFCWANAPSSSGPTPPAGVTVKVTPSGQRVAPNGSLQFTAVVNNEVNQAVTWAVGGVVGGSPAMGIIDSDGIYNAPSRTGPHTITATSVAVPSAVGTANVFVTSGGGGKHPIY